MVIATVNRNATAHAAISPRPLAAATLPGAVAVPRPPPGSAASPPIWCGTSAGRWDAPTARTTRPGPSPTAADAAGSPADSRAYGPGESRTRWRSRGSVPPRGRRSFRVSPAGRTAIGRLVGAPEHLADRQARQCCDDGPDDETACCPQDPHISSMGSSTASRRCAVTALVDVGWRSGGTPARSTGAECHARGDGLHTTAPEAESVEQDGARGSAVEIAASNGPWPPCPQERPNVIPLVAALCPCGDRGFVPPDNRLIDQDNAQAIWTNGSVLWTLRRTEDVWPALRSAVGPAWTQPCRRDSP